MNPFDHFVTRELRCSAYVRYVDDVLLFGDDSSQLLRWRDAVVNRLARYRLTVHEGAHPRAVSEGIPFLGFVIFPSRRRLKRRKGLHFRRRLAALFDEQRQGRRRVADVASRVRSWLNRELWQHHWPSEGGVAGGGPHGRAPRRGANASVGRGRGRPIARACESRS